jgi:hypothetical protein
MCAGCRHRGAASELFGRQVGKVGDDDYQLYAPDVLVSGSREQERRGPYCD